MCTDAQNFKRSAWCLKIESANTAFRYFSPSALKEQTNNFRFLNVKSVDSFLKV